MAVPKIEGSQRDFSAGQVDLAALRADDFEITRKGARQMRNLRILNSRALRNRPGRRALFLSDNRVDQVLVAPGQIFYLCFSAGTLTIRDANGALLAGNVAYPWTSDGLRSIVWTLIRPSALERQIVITYPGMRPKVAMWTSAAGWSFGNFNFGQNGDGAFEVPFYRLAEAGVTIQPSGYVGNITVQASAGVFAPAQVGTIIRFVNRQMLVTGWNTSQNISATVLQALFHTTSYTTSGGSITGTVAIGEIWSDSAGNEGEVFSFTTSGGAVTGISFNMLSANDFAAGQTIIGPSGHFVVDVPTVSGTPGRTQIWDEQVWSDYRGWPQSCFTDQNRLGFCNLPSLPSAIAWSATALYSNFDIGASPTDAMIELAPDNCQVYHVVAGPESSEFVFTDVGVYYIPISVTNPLRPGSVAFQVLSRDGCSNVQPRAVQEVVLFVSAGGSSLMAVVAVGAYTRPYQVKDLTEIHSDLFNNIQTIAAPTGEGQFPERYVYVLNGNGGGVVVGKYDLKPQPDAQIGWVPYDGGGNPIWVCALGATVTFVSTYAPNGIATVTLCEELDDDYDLDATIVVSSPPSGLAPAGGRGPLWWIGGGSVSLMDQGRPLGTYQIDVAGNIVPQNNAGENLASPTLVAGQPWTATLEPFIGMAAPGQDVGQRVKRRRVSRFGAYVVRSTGFYFARLYNGTIGANLPAAGTAMALRRIPAWMQGDNPTLAPPEREGAFFTRPVGRSYNPRVALIKDTPGSLDVLEIATEVTV